MKCQRTVLVLLTKQHPLGPFKRWDNTMTTLMAESQQEACELVVAAPLHPLLNSKSWPRLILALDSYVLTIGCQRPNR